MTSSPGDGTVDDDTVLSVRDLTVRAGSRTILRDVGLQVKRGQVVGLIGANGSGKTTLLRAILGLTPISSGRVAIHGAQGDNRRRTIGYSPQTISFDPDLPLRARDFVGLGYDGYRLGLPFPSRKRRAVAEEMLAAVDALSFASTRMGRLSGGERQRILIAHALAGQPSLLLLDEPLANLDLRSEGQLVEILARVARERGVGVLLSTHDVNPLLAVMDTVAYIADGRVATGTPEEVVTTESLTSLYGQHVDVLRVHGRVVVVAGPPDQEFSHTSEEPVASVVER